MLISKPQGSHGDAHSFMRFIRFADLFKDLKSIYFLIIQLNDCRHTVIIVLAGMNNNFREA